MRGFQGWFGCRIWYCGKRRKNKEDMFNVNASEFKPSWMQDEPDPIPKAPVKEAAKEPAVMSKPLKATESGHDSEVAITEELKSTKNTNEKSESEKLESGETIDPELEDELAKELAAEQEAAESDTEALERGLKELKVLDDREHVNIVFIGHVDAGKSTLSGQIL